MSEENNEPRPTTVSVSVVQSELEKVLSQGVRTTGDNIIHEPTCMICASPHRKIIEDKWVETHSYDEIHQLLEGKTETKISDDVIGNHCRYHYDRGIREQQKIEYIDKIKRYSNNELTTLDRISFALATIMERIIEINSLVPGGDYSQTDIDKIKSGELTKLINMWAKFTKMNSDLMGEMKDTGELISIPKEAFIKFFNESLTEAKSDTEKEIVNKILTKLASLSQA